MGLVFSIPVVEGCTAECAGMKWSWERDWGLGKQDVWVGCSVKRREGLLALLFVGADATGGILRLRWQREGRVLTCVRAGEAETWR